jgi:hypothetical protein
MSRIPFPSSTLSFISLLLAPCLPTHLQAAPTTPDAVDIHLAGKLVGRYQVAHDVSSNKARQETYKPFLHLFDPEGKHLITKGAGGEYTHHRGIFIGWMKMGFEGQTLDRWHMIGGEQVVQGSVRLLEGKKMSSAESTVHWNDAEGKPFIIEERSFTFHTPPDPAYVLLDFQSTLTAPRGTVTLDGDPEHAGIHFRPSDAVDRKATAYLFPGTDTNPRKSPDLPWIAENFTLDGKSYSVVQFNHPQNPKGTKSSAYRDYGRIGMFPTATIPEGGSLVLRYRFLVSEGDFPEASFIQSVANSFTGKTDPVSAVTRRHADVPPPPKAKKTIDSKAKPAPVAGSAP